MNEQYKQECHGVDKIDNIGYTTMEKLYIAHSVFFISLLAFRKLGVFYET